MFSLNPNKWSLPKPPNNEIKYIQPQEQQVRRVIPLKKKIVVSKEYVEQNTQDSTNDDIRIELPDIERFSTNEESIPEEEKCKIDTQELKAIDAIINKAYSNVEDNDNIIYESEVFQKLNKTKNQLMKKIEKINFSSGKTITMDKKELTTLLKSFYDYSLQIERVLKDNNNVNY